MKVFISYSHVDRAVAGSIAEILKQLAIEYFLDTKDVNWGDEITQKVKGGLEESSYVVIIISPASLKSQWVPFETGYALGRGAHILPFLTHPSLEVPSYIRDLHYKGDLESVKAYFETERASSVYHLSPDQAKKRIATLGIAYDPLTFREMVTSGDVEAVQLFLRAGIRPDIKDQTGATPLYGAITFGHSEIARLLIEAGANVNLPHRSFGTPLLHAIHKHRTQTCADLIEAGADMSFKPEGGHTPLGLAVTRNYLDIVAILINEGVDVNADSDGTTVLHIASRNGDSNMVKALIAAGAKTDARNYFGQTALDIASTYSFPEIVQILTEAGAR
jgi:FOG: Ankyrin repeat